MFFSVRFTAVLLLMYCLFVPVPSVLAKEINDVNVLFIGNSYTNFNELPNIVRQLAVDKGKKFEYTKQTNGGANFKYHYEHGDVKAKLSGVNVVVLQDQSLEPVIDKKTMFTYGKLLSNDIDQVSGARKIYYSTWAYKGITKWMINENSVEKYKPIIANMTDSLYQSYSELAKETHGEVAPIGFAWRYVRESHPEIELYTPDNSHPNINGSYLTALVLYSIIFDEEPKNMLQTFMKPGWPNGIKTMETFTMNKKVQNILESAAAKAYKLKNDITE